MESIAIIGNIDLLCKEYRYSSQGTIVVLPRHNFLLLLLVVGMVQNNLYHWVEWQSIDDDFYLSENNIVKSTSVAHPSVG